MLPIFMRTLWASFSLSTLALGDVKVVPEKVTPAVPDVQQLPLPDAVHLSGMLGARIDANWQNRLLTYYLSPGDESALAACRRVGNLLCDTFGKEKRAIIKAGEHVGMAATSVLEPMVLLYRTTGDKKYLDFCEYILWAWEQPHGPK